MKQEFHNATLADLPMWFARKNLTQPNCKVGSTVKVRMLKSVEEPAVVEKIARCSDGVFYRVKFTQKTLLVTERIHIPPAALGTMPVALVMLDGKRTRLKSGGIIRVHYDRLKKQLFRWGKTARVPMTAWVKETELCSV